MGPDQDRHRHCGTHTHTPPIYTNINNDLAASGALRPTDTVAKILGLILVSANDADTLTNTYTYTTAETEVYLHAHAPSQSIQVAKHSLSVWSPLM